MCNIRYVDICSVLSAKALNNYKFVSEILLTLSDEEKPFENIYKFRGGNKVRIRKKKTNKEGYTPKLTE